MIQLAWKPLRALALLGAAWTVAASRTPEQIASTGLLILTSTGVAPNVSSVRADESRRIRDAALHLWNDRADARSATIRRREPA